MPIDYSKWAALDCSDSDEDVPKPKPAANKDKPAAVSKLSAPKEAKGSEWNASNYHWEEQKLDKWGKQRLTELVGSEQMCNDEIEFQGSRLNFIYNLAVSNLEGDAWTHIRKGKTVVGYNFEATLKLTGRVKTSSREEAVSGEMSMDLMVDNDPDLEVHLKEGSGLPFAAELRKCIITHITACISQFIIDLAEKAEKQKDKVESQAPAPVVSAQTLPSGSPSGSQQVQAKSHFGGRVQVGGHSKEGLRIS